MRELRIRRARNAARELRRTSGAGNEVPVPVEDIAHALGIEIVYGPLENALASLVRVGKRARIRVAESHHHPGQLRFSIAHELGHYVLEHRLPMRLSDVVAANQRLHDKQAESEADAFAAELLLPEALVRRRCEVSPVDLRLVHAIADDFQASPVATAVRFAELTSERVAAVYSENGAVRWAIRSDTFWPRIDRGQRLLPWSVAYEFFQRGAMSTGPQAVDASAWVSSHSARDGEEIIEDAMPLPQLHGVLSLVWIPETCRSLACRVA